MFTDPLFSLIGHQELVYGNKSRKGFIDHKRDIEFSEKREETFVDRLL